MEWGFSQMCLKKSSSLSPRWNALTAQAMGRMGVDVRTDLFSPEFIYAKFADDVPSFLIQHVSDNWVTVTHFSPGNIMLHSVVPEAHSNQVIVCVPSACAFTLYVAWLSLV